MFFIQINKAYAYSPFNYIIHYVNIVCEKSGKEDGYSIDLWGISNKELFFASRFDKGSNPIIFNITGKLTSEKFIIQGTGQYKEKRSSKINFSKKRADSSSGVGISVSEYLRTKIDGKHGNRNC
ncbi:hypothetical protein OA085_01390, partial [Alphaproteobacteria bacterium]|nr:hypothetical protein [Alphaproteobacteria bacterium]